MESELRKLIREEYAWTLVVLESRDNARSLASAVANFLITVKGNELSYMSQQEFQTLIRGKVAEILKQKGLNPSLASEVEKAAAQLLSDRGSAPKKRQAHSRKQIPPQQQKKTSKLASFFGMG